MGLTLLKNTDVDIIRITEALYNLRPGATILANFRGVAAEQGIEGL